MLDKRIVRVKVTGRFACFTRPDFKVERLTYPCMTPSAARGILDSILWKPEFQWYIRKIIVLKPIRFTTIKRNEIKFKQGREPIVIENSRAQRNSVVLKNVEYLIEASLFQKEQNGKNKPEKYIGKKGIDADKDGIFTRRLKSGQCWRRPYLGVREFAAEFSEPDGTEQPVKETIPVGSMLFDIFYDDQGKPEPLFFYDVAIRGGILNCEVPENDKMMQSSHIQSPLNSEMSSIIYEFNHLEEEAA